MGTSVEWLYFILQAFNAGDLAKYQELCHNYKAALTAQPALVENEKKLWEKINILCLMELIFRFHWHSFIWGGKVGRTDFGMQVRRVWNFANMFMKKTGAETITDAQIRENSRKRKQRKFWGLREGWGPH
jgi:hypothetical protein